MPTISEMYPPEVWRKMSKEKKDFAKRAIAHHEKVSQMSDAEVRKEAIAAREFLGI